MRQYFHGAPKLIFTLCLMFAVGNSQAGVFSDALNMAGQIQAKPKSKKPLQDTASQSPVSPKSGASAASPSSKKDKKASADVKWLDQDTLMDAQTRKNFLDLSADWVNPDRRKEVAACFDSLLLAVNRSQAEEYEKQYFDAVGKSADDATRQAYQEMKDAKTDDETRQAMADDAAARNGFNQDYYGKHHALLDRAKLAKEKDGYLHARNLLYAEGARSPLNGVRGLKGLLREVVQTQGSDSIMRNGALIRFSTWDGICTMTS